MRFLGYSTPTLDLNNPDHREIVRQFVSVCKRELQLRRQIESKFTNKPTKTRTTKKQRVSLVTE